MYFKYNRNTNILFVLNYSHQSLALNNTSRQTSLFKIIFLYTIGMGLLYASQLPLNTPTKAIVVDNMIRNQMSYQIEEKKKSIPYFLWSLKIKFKRLWLNIQHILYEW
jgi:hypothetical protein